MNNSKKFQKYHLLLLIFIGIISACFLAQNNRQKEVKEISLDFIGYLDENKNYKHIQISAFKGFKLKKINHNGFCEYQFAYSDSLIFYVSSDIYSGSRLNYGNRYSIGIDTYAISRNLEPIDTI